MIYFNYLLIYLLTKHNTADNKENKLNKEIIRCFGKYAGFIC